MGKAQSHYLQDSSCASQIPVFGVLAYGVIQNQSEFITHYKVTDGFVAVDSAMFINSS